ncbi:MAG: hypothetical protein CVU81_00575 [Euryarchaeota archaeon HGW-Euryarchaeota-1]|nr:MAG: hypothetical protein CVU81_00575 [Euryarchaeota archaeon HGW-Euryarchaeota-1]
MKNSQIFVFLALFVVLGVGVYLFFDANNQIHQKSIEISGLAIVKAELENKTENLSIELTEYKSQLVAFNQTYQKLLQSKEANFTNPLFIELAQFLEVDETEKEHYNKQSFDCTGFALKVQKNARLHGFRAGIAEIEFNEGNSAGHMLNVFQTTDKGTVYVDVTGTANGGGVDKIGYAVIGAPYGAMPITSVINTTTIDCNKTCQDFEENFTGDINLNPLTYEYFENVKMCRNLFETCYKGKGGIYSVDAPILKLYAFIKDKLIFEFQNATVKNVQIYW